MYSIISYIQFETRLAYSLVHITNNIKNTDSNIFDKLIKLCGTKCGSDDMIIKINLWSLEYVMNYKLAADL